MRNLQKPLISIITINLNNASGLSNTLQSLAGQTWENFESIIIDGGSSDGSVEVIKGFSAQKTLRISKWVSEKDHGLYHAQNKGIKAAKGEYTLFLNSGDYLFSPATLDNLKAELWTADIIYGNILLKHRFRNRESNMPDTISPEHLYYSTLMHPATFIRRDLFAKVGLYREDFKICSDYYFFVKAILKSPGHR
jgi:glycosyltransferase involved in cell wall biosynthesis